MRVYWPFYLPGLFALLIVLTLIKGLAWQWKGILTASPAAPPVAAPAAPGRSAVPAPPVSASGNAAQPAPAAGAKRPLPPTNDPPPRNAVDQLGVTYDAQGVAVMGIDVDPNGVYNVPPGRQVRIGGPSGSLFDVQPDGRITPATRVKDIAS